MGCGANGLAQDQVPECRVGRQGCSKAALGRPSMDLAPTHPALLQGETTGLKWIGETSHQGKGFLKPTGPTEKALGCFLG